jgi:(E)-4-hydroxy-3-methyl-but-2-enyl pyrophosphate reductase
MKVLVADKCGFCPGVRNAISMAERVLIEEAEGGPVYSLGPIIHNKEVVDRLAKAGLRTVESMSQIPEVGGQGAEGRDQRSEVADQKSGPNSAAGTVLIRSHGVAPKEMESLKQKGLRIVDATCVLVKRVQRIAQQLEAEGYEVVIIGEENHPEVQAVVGCVSHVVVVAEEEDLARLPQDGRLGIVCQTTQSPEHLGRMLGAIGRGSFKELKVINTLCREATKRQESAVELCKRVDVMFVLGGLHSANTRRLAELCEKHNPQTFHLQNWDELDKKVLLGKQVAGVTAGASTPNWVIEEFVEHLEKFGEKT